MPLRLYYITYKLKSWFHVIRQVRTSLQIFFVLFCLKLYISCLGFHSNFKSPFSQSQSSDVVFALVTVRSIVLLMFKPTWFIDLSTHEIASGRHLSKRHRSLEWKFCHVICSNKKENRT